MEKSAYQSSHRVLTTNRSAHLRVLLALHGPPLISPGNVSTLFLPLAAARTHAYAFEGVMIHESMAEKVLCAQAGDYVVVEQVEPRRVQQACLLEVVEIGLASSKKGTTKSTQASASLAGSEEDTKSNWLTLLIREVLGKHLYFHLRNHPSHLPTPH
jgi:hypothetical protein